jgi:cysteinyl-tRNA synthetase
MADDLNTPLALVAQEEMLSDKRLVSREKAGLAVTFDSVLGVGLIDLERIALRIAPKAALVEEPAVEAKLAARKDARAAKDFVRSDALRDELIGLGVEVMDGDPLGWDWKLG